MQDTDEALAWQEERESVCSGCGHPRQDAQDEDQADAWQAVAVRCHACAARDAAAQEWAEKGGDTGGLFWRVTQ